MQGILPIAMTTLARTVRCFRDTSTTASGWSLAIGTGTGFALALITRKKRSSEEITSPR